MTARGTCPRCGRTVALNSDGRIRKHGRTQFGGICSGGGMLPKGS